MAGDSKSGAEGVGGQFPNEKLLVLCTRVRDIREELGRRIQRMSAKSGLTIADRMQLVYYQKVLGLYASLSPDAMVRSGYGMSGHCSAHQEDVRELNKILDYILPEGDTTTPGGSLSDALPPSARPSSPKKGRPVTQRPVALRALQLQIDTGQTWRTIAQQVCDCKKEHDQSCTENIRQSVNGLKRLLRQLGIQLPPKATHPGE